MAKTKKAKKPAKTPSNNKYQIEDNVEIPNFMYARSPKFVYPHEYGLVERLENGQSIAFNTDEDKKKFDAIGKAVQKEHSKRKFTIKRVNETNSRIWRNDKRKSWAKSTKKSD